MKLRINPLMAPFGIIMLMVWISLHFNVSICQAYTLTATPKPTNGTVTSNVGGINCGSGGSACTSTNINAGTTVTLTATPSSASYTFTSWTVGGSTSTANPFTFPMPGANVSGSVAFTYHAPENGVCGTASGGTFTVAPSSNLCNPGTSSAVTGTTTTWAWTCNGNYGGANPACSANRKYLLTYSAQSGGTLSGTASQQLAYNTSATTVTAVPDTNYYFSNWTEGATVVSTSPNLSISNVTANHANVAHFVAANLNISPKPTGGTVTSSVGGINCGDGGSVCSAYIAPGTPVVLTATPGSANFTFVSWNVNGLSDSTNPYSALMPPAAITARAGFSYHDTINGACGTANGGVFSAPPASEQCSSGGVINMTGTSTTWEWTCKGSYGGTSSTCSAGRQYLLSFTAEGGGSLTGAVSQQLNYNANASTVTAVADSDHPFIGWTEGGSFISTTPALKVYNVTASHSYTALFDAGWKIEVVDAPKYFNNSYSRAIAIEKTTNRPHVVYGGDRLYHAYNNGSQWLIETIDSTPFTGEFASIAIDSGNKVHVAYYDVSRQDLKYATNSMGPWAVTTIDSTGDAGQYNSIALDGNGKAHISYYDATLKRLKYATNTAGSWTTAAVENSGSDHGQYSSIAVDTDNKVHISFYDSSNRQLHYATNTPGFWWWYVVDPSWSGEYTSIAVDANKTVHISYHNSLDYQIKYAAGSQTSWTKTVIEDNHSYENAHTSLGLDSAGKVHISYFDTYNHDLKYATNASGTWTSTTLDSAGLTGRFNSIAVDGNNKLHISYYDETNRNFKYATNVSGSWGNSIIDSAGDVGTYGSLARDAAGKEHIGYYDAKNQDLKYATNASGAWVTSAVDSTGDVGQYSSLAVDSNGKAHISYYDDTNNDLKYATNTSGVWVTSVIDSAGFAGYYGSLAIDSNNKLHIFYDAAEGALSNLKYATNTSGTWSTVVIDSSAGAKDISTAIDINNKIHIGYVSGHYAYYATNSSGSWISQNVDDDPDWLRSLTSIAADPLGKIHLSYYRESLPDSTYFQYAIMYTSNASGSWSNPYPIDYVGLAPANSSIKTDSAGKVHVSYYRSGYRSGKLMLASNVDGTWKSSAVDSSGDAGAYSSLSLDSLRGPHISYYDVARHALKYASKPDVIPPAGTVGGLSYYCATQTPTLALTCTDPDGSGCSHMRFSNDGTTWSSPTAYAATSTWTLSPGDGTKAVYAQFRDFAGNWSVTSMTSTKLDTTPPSGSVSINGGAAQTHAASVTLSLSANDSGSGVYLMQFSNDNVNWTTAEPYAAVKAWILPAGAGTRNVYVKFRDVAGTWTGAISDSIELVAGVFTATAESLDSGSAWSSVAIDSNNKPHIGYYDSTGTSLKYATKPDGLWAYATIDDIGYTAPMPSLKMDSNNKAHVSYYYEVNYNGWVRELRYATNTSGGWVVTTIEAGNNAGEKNSLAVDHNNKVHVSYRIYDIFTGNYALKYATNASGAWVTTVIDNNGSVGYENAIAVDSNNHVHIAYYDKTNTNLKYATNASGTWVKSTADSSAGVGGSVSVVADSGNNIHIAYLDAANKNLKYATNASGGWQSESIDSSTTDPISASIGADASGKVYIGYIVSDSSLAYSTYSQYSKLITNASGTWSTSIVDTRVLTGGTLSLAVDTAKKVHMSYIDGTASDLRYVYVDPVLKPGIIINSGAPYTNAVAATLDLSVSGPNISGMQLSNDGLAWTTPESYTDTKTWTLAGGDGPKKLYTQFRDNAGNWSNVCTGTIMLDMTAPEGTIIINNGAMVTQSRSVILSLAALDENGIAEMRISNSNIFRVDGEPYDVSKTWTLSTNDGLKTVYASFKDNAGNWSLDRSDTITLDYQETLTASSVGNGSGTVVSNIGGINYSYPTAQSAIANLDRGTPVTLTATAASGSTATWQDCAANGGTTGGTSTEATCSFSSLTSSRTVTANFHLNQHTMNVTIDGSGFGTVLSDPAGIAGNVSSSVQFGAGTGIALQATPAAYSFFAHWSGECSGLADCILVMDTDRNVTATFDLDTLHKVRIGDTTNYASTLQAAYGGASNGSIIKAWGTEFAESFSCDQSKDVTLKGGYNSEYIGNSGYTTLLGTLTVRRGSIRVEKLIIRNK